MNNDIYIIGEIGVESPKYMNNTLKLLLDSIALSDKEQPLNIYIQSVGGGVYEGKAMYKALKQLPIQPNTIGMGLIASVASIIFLAGNKATRKVTDTEDFLIHLPMGGAQGNAIDLEKTAKELRVMENEFADIYATETDLTKEEALAMMVGDEFIPVSTLKEKGFVSEVLSFKAVAKLDTVNINKKEDEMNNEDAKGFLDRIEGVFAKYFKKDDPTNKIVTAADGVEIDFTELEADANPIVGDIAVVDGAKAEGSYVMPSGETFVFVDGALTEMMPAEGEDDGADMEALKAEIESLKEQLSTATASITEKETLINSKEEEFKAVKIDLTELKASITSKMDYDPEKKKEEQADDKVNRVAYYKNKLKK